MKKSLQVVLAVLSLLTLFNNTNAIVAEDVYTVSTNDNGQVYIDELIVGDNEEIIVTTLYGETSIYGISANAVNCSNVKSIIIPDDIQDVASFAFYNCQQIESITIGCNTVYQSDSFDDLSNLKTLKVLGEGELISNNAPFWANANNIEELVIGEGVTALHSGNFTNITFDKYYVKGDCTVEANTFSNNTKLIFDSNTQVGEGITNYEVNEICFSSETYEIFADDISECFLYISDEVIKSSLTVNYSIEGYAGLVKNKNNDNCYDLQAFNVGTTVITVSNGTIVSKCTVTVKPKELSAIEFEDDIMEVMIGKTINTRLLTNPNDIELTGVKYITSQSYYATVNSKGQIYGRRRGTVTITASVSGTDIKDTVKVYVRSKPTSLRLNAYSKTLMNTKTFQLVPAIYPSYAYKRVTYTSSNTDVLTVDENGLVRTVSPGVAKVTVMTANGLKKYCTFTVKAEPETISYSDVVLMAGKYVTVKPTITPSNSYSTFSLSSEDKNIAYIYYTRVVAKAVGETDITVKAYNGVESTFKVTVKAKPTKIALPYSTLTMYEGQSYPLEATLSPVGCYDKLTYSSSRSYVASVNSAGLITAKKLGTTYITVKTANGLYKRMTVKVLRAPSTIRFNKGQYDYWVGQEITFSPIVYPSTAYKANLDYTSSNEEVAKFVNGKLVMLSAGETTITVRTINGKTASTIVNVTNSIERIDVEASSIDIMVGNTYEAKPIIVGDMATNDKISFSTNLKNYATVSSTGIIKGVRVGSAIITIKSASGKTATIKVNVKSAPTKIVCKESQVTIAVDSSKQLTHTISPSTAFKAVSYTSQNTDIALVDENGLVTGVNPGVTIVEIKTFNDKTATCKVTVLANPDGVSFKDTNDKEILIQHDVNENHKAEVNPINSYDIVNYSSSNPLVATVNKDGKITGISKGVTTITATTINGLTASYELEVYVTSIDVDVTSIPMMKGKTFRTSVNLDTANKNVTVKYKSNNTEIATISDDGIITAVDYGRTTIEVSSSDDEDTVILTVEVRDDIVANGIDVSRWQGNISEANWAKIKADGIDFVIIRIGNGYEATGKGYRDQTFDNNYQRAKNAGLDVGVYHYVNCLTPEQAKAEAAQLIEWLENGDIDYQFEYPILMDFETTEQGKLDSNTKGSLIDTYCTDVAAAGYEVGIYSFASLLKSVNGDILDKYTVGENKQRAIALAQWSTTDPNRHYKGSFTIWQYTSSGNVNGVYGRCDMDLAFFDYPTYIKENHKNGY